MRRSGWILAVVLLGSCGPATPCSDKCEDTCEQQEADGVSMPCPPNAADFCMQKCGGSEASAE